MPTTSSEPRRPELTLAQAKATMIEMSRAEERDFNPGPGWCYLTGMATKRFGDRYFVPIDGAEYVGRFLRYERGGNGNGSWARAIFLRDGKEVTIDFDYEGRRVFHSARCPSSNANKPIGGYRQTRRASKRARRTRRKTRK